MNKWIAEFELEDGDTMAEHMDLEYKGAKIDFHCRPMWIPCSERLPFAEYGESANVLATCRNREQESPDEYRWVRILYFNGGNWCYPTGETYEQQVIAWMPLPKEYKGGEEDGN